VNVLLPCFDANKHGIGASGFQVSKLVSLLTVELALV
jgi:hypothetical protein